MPEVDTTRKHKLAGREPDVFVFPVPVIEEKKYLVHFDTREFAEFFIEALALGRLIFLNDKIRFERLHQDGRTPIFRLDPPCWHLKLFTPSEASPEPGRRVEALLNTKLKSYLYSAPEERLERLEDLSKTWRSQTKCKTCVAMGILDPANKKLLDRWNPS